ncbi:MAG: carbon-nitrogen hydrolase [Phycisphaeraceae bacterium]|nr:carbon-nitrogen hydrolase [Phycisphaeraceae bacterium]
MTTLRLALLQHACVEDPTRNLDHAITLMRDAARRDAQLLVTQELFTSRYFPQVESEAGFSLAESIPGPTTSRLSDLARELHVHIAASLFEKRAPGVFHNTSVLIDPAGRIAGKYRKMHIPDDPGFYEKFYFTPGDLGFQVVPVDGANVGTLICWDQWFPEAARLTCLQGAQLLLYPTAIAHCKGEDETERARQRDAWRTIQRSHAIANGVFVVAVNRIGAEGELDFFGSSFVAAPGGEVIAEAPRDSEQVLIVDCDLTKLDAARQIWPFFRDRRIDAYAELTQRWASRD